MRTRVLIAALLFPMIQAVLFGLGLIPILATQTAAQAQVSLPWMIALTVLVSAPAAWFMAPRLRLRHRRRREAGVTRD